jgi:hypothetical protein
MAEHRVPLLGDALRRRADPARSSDPRVRRLVSALATLEIAPAPTAELRTELRRQLVAVTPRLVADGVAAPETKQRPVEDVRDRYRLRRPMVVTACLLTALVLMLGGAVWLSRSALPGDVLYGLKRASENTELALAGSAADKGRLELEFAANRIDEVGELVPGTGALALGPGTLADGPLSEHAAGLVQQTLASADDDIRAAAQMLGTAAVNSASPNPLDAIIAWAPPQVRAMHTIIGRLPDGTARADALTTSKLIRDARARAVRLEAQLGCGCLDRSGSDSLGPLPCRHPCAVPRTPATNGPAGPSSSTPSSGPPGRSTGTSGPTGHPATTAGASYPVTYPGHSARPGGPKASGAPPAGPRRPTRSAGAPPRSGSPPHTPPSTRRGGTGHPGTPTPTPRPSAPTRTAPGAPGPPGVPTPSGSVGSCGLTLELGPIGIGIGAC